MMGIIVIRKINFLDISIIEMAGHKLEVEETICLGEMPIPRWDTLTPVTLALLYRCLINSDASTSNLHAVCDLLGSDGRKFWFT